MSDLREGYSGEESVPLGKLLPYVADLGTVGFVTAFVIAAAGIVAESAYSGLVFNQVSPQKLVSAMVICGALSLLASERKRPTWRTAVFSVLATATTVLVTVLAWDYFAPLPERVALTVAVALVSLAVVIGAINLFRKP